MYAVIRQYSTVRGDVDEIVRIDREGFVPLIRGIAGFVSYGIGAGETGVASVSMFETESGADESNRKAAAFVQKSLASALPDPPHITKGQVLHFESNPDSPMRFGVLRHIKVDDSDFEELHLKARAELIPLLKNLRGFASHAVVDPGSGSILAFTVYAEPTSPDEAVKTANEWRSKSVPHLGIDDPEVFKSEIKLFVTPAGVPTA
jgi:hypothetical protein